MATDLASQDVQEDRVNKLIEILEELIDAEEA